MKTFTYLSDKVVLSRDHTVLQHALVNASAQERSKAVVMCAHNAPALRMAWTQIRCLQQVYEMENETFIVYHADELDPSDVVIDQFLKRLRSLPNVRVDNLMAWYKMSYGDPKPREGIKRFQGFFCKVGALLAAPYDVVALIDTDIIFMDNPFSLISTSIFLEKGSYLFRDRRFSGNDYLRESVEAYRKRLRKLWRVFHPDCPRHLSRALANSPPFTGWSYDLGESAFVLMNKQRHQNTTSILQHMVSSELFETSTKFVWGDKEVYWQALVLADEVPGINPYANADVGLTNDQHETCCYQYANAQWVWFGTGRPRIMYINGNGVENLVSGQDDTLLRSWVSDPLDYFSPNTRIDYMGDCCNRGANPMPSYALEMMHAYRLTYESFDMNVSAETIW